MLNNVKNYTQKKRHSFGRGLLGHTVYRSLTEQVVMRVVTSINRDLTNNINTAQHWGTLLLLGGKLHF